MSKILVLSFYFKPDLSAGSFRTTYLIQALLDKLPESTSIDVLTTLPNRYKTFVSDAPPVEKSPRLTVLRAKLPVHSSGMLDQTKAFLSYAKFVYQSTRAQEYELVYATSSRLMTACLGALVARKKRVPLYLDIRDIFVDTIKDVLPDRFSWFFGGIFSLVERFTMTSASKINLVSNGFLPYFKKHYPRQRYSVFTNGVDDEFILPTSLVASISAASSRRIKVVYAGNIGEGQGLHSIIPELANHFKSRMDFIIVGDGGRAQKLKDSLTEKSVDNVQVRSPVGRLELVELYQSADILFLHLNDLDAFRKVLPSKIFEYAAMGKPIWAGVAGHAADFVNEHISNAVVFAPCNVTGAIKSFEKLSIEFQPREDFIDKFSRKNIMRLFASDIVAERKNPL